jgi:hypothetical protein
MEYFLFGCLLQFSRNDRFIEQVVCLVEIENNVQFAHVAEVTVQNLDVVMDHLERQHKETTHNIGSGMHRQTTRENPHGAADTAMRISADEPAQAMICTSNPRFTVRTSLSR